MKNAISKEKRLEVYKKTLQMYTDKSYPQEWLEKNEDTVESANYGLCQVLRTIWVGDGDVSDGYIWPDGTKWSFENTTRYFPEFKKHWVTYSNLTNEKRIEILKLCIHDIEG